MSFFMSNARRNPKEEARYKKEVMIMTRALRADGQNNSGMFFLTCRVCTVLDYTIGKSKLNMTRGWVGVVLR